MKVKLTYFRETGKYYSEGEFETNPYRDKPEQSSIEGKGLWEIWAEVREIEKKLPGLIEGHSDFYVTVDVPDHPHNHPHLFLPEGK